MLVEHALGQHLHEEPETERDEHLVVEQAEDRDEVRNEIDRRKRISGDEKPERPRMPRRPRVPRRQPRRVEINTQPMRERGGAVAGQAGQVSRPRRGASTNGRNPSWPSAARCWGERVFPASAATGEPAKSTKRGGRVSMGG